jgi:hypothetical protein
MSKENSEFRHASLTRAMPLAIGSGEATLTAGTLSLEPYAAWFARV